MKLDFIGYTRVPGAVASAVAAVVAEVAGTAAAAVLPVLPAPPAIDGRLDDAVWGHALRVERFYEIAPGDNSEPPVATVAWLGYDAGSLYVAFRCDDPDLRALRATWAERDRVLSDQDFVQVDVDSRNDGRFSVLFRVNPFGSEADGIYDEASANDDFAPDFVIDSATSIDGGGWSVELRIPLATLRHPPGGGGEWRVTLLRNYPRELRRQFLANPLPRGSACWLCNALRIEGIDGVTGGRSVTLMPYVKAEGEANGEAEADAGLDLTWLLRPDTVADVTVNPDFSQVEADAAQLSENRRFALFFPEQRPFFLEGRDLLSSPLAAIHTRTVTSPRWGARLTGRPGRGAFTLLVADDRGGGSTIVPGTDGSALAPQAAALVALGRARLVVGTWTLGVLATAREGSGSDHNWVAGADLEWRPSGVDTVAAQMLVSETLTGDQPLRGGAALASWQHGAPHLSWRLLLERSDEEFRADSGFMPQVGVWRREAGLTLTAYPERVLLQSASVGLDLEQVDELGGELVTRTVGIGAGVDGILGASLWWYPADRERTATGVQARLAYGRLDLHLRPSRVVPRVDIVVRDGEETDLERGAVGHGRELSASLALAPARRFSLDLSGAWHRLGHDDDPAAGFTAVVARVRCYLAVGGKAFVRATTEWENTRSGKFARPATETSHRLATSLLLGYRFDALSALFVGWSEELVGGRPWHRSGRELFLKLSYALGPLPRAR